MISGNAGQWQACVLLVGLGSIATLHRGGIDLRVAAVQPLRSAHVLSHDVATATLCWAICDALALFALTRRLYYTREDA